MYMHVHIHVVTTLDFFQGLFIAFTANMHKKVPAGSIEGNTLLQSTP